MDVIYARCAGLDVPKATVFACVRLASGNRVDREVRTFATTTTGLLELLAWLTEQGCCHVAMEATGVYWKPVWHILSDGPFELVLANAAHIKAVPGRKTDVNDATWIADLLAHGLIRASFVPDATGQELRGLLRTRKQLVREQTSHTQRLQKVLEDANIKLDSVISDLLGTSGRAMIEALIEGESNPVKLADLAHRRLQAPRAVLCEALRGRVTAHHRFLLKLHLQQIDGLAAAVAEIDGEVEAVIARSDAGEADHPPFRAALAVLLTMPGIGPLAARTILAEIGLDMARFPTAGHLLSWAGLCPGHDESAGKRRSTRLRKGDPWLKTLLVPCAWAASRQKDSYYKALFYRLRSRRGAQKAICAVAASMLTALYHMLRNGTLYQDLGPDHFDRRSKESKAKHLLGQLAKLGYKVEATSLPEAA